MQNSHDQQNNNASLLDELFLTPSNEIKTDRFAANTTDAADCNGQSCASGTCRMYV